MATPSSRAGRGQKRRNPATSIGQSSPGWATVDAGRRQYLETIRFPMLSRKEESRLARLVREEGDRAATDTLVTSHLRLVGKVAMRYRG
jgi:DNA-directed RNA polymerase sigma subunit (sigma70/sigma32)